MNASIETDLSDARGVIYVPITFISNKDARLKHSKHATISYNRLQRQLNPVAWRIRFTVQMLHEVVSALQ